MTTLIGRLLNIMLLLLGLIFLLNGLEVIDAFKESAYFYDKRDYTFGVGIGLVVGVLFVMFYDLVDACRET